MRTKIFIIISAIFFSLQAIGQVNTSGLDIRVGVGVSLLGTGDMTTFNYENELNLSINQYFAAAMSVNLGRSNYGVFENASFTQGNLNVYLSPFRNNKPNDFRIGTGLTYYHVSDVYIYSQRWHNGELVEEDYKYNTRRSIGLNIILENTFVLSDRYLLGLKLFTQPYKNGDINSGAMMKIGMRL